MNNNSKVNSSFEDKRIVQGVIAVTERLEEMQLDRRLLLEISKKTFSAGNEITDSCPSGSLGWERYKQFVKGLVEAGFDGWDSYRKNGVHGIYNKESRVALLYQNVSVACDLGVDPQPIISKGDGVKHLCQVNLLHNNGTKGKGQQVPLLFPDHNMIALASKKYRVDKVYICMFDLNGALEISCPTLNAKGEYEDFVERIIIAESFNDYDQDVVSNVTKREEITDDIDTEGTALKITKKL